MSQRTAGLGWRQRQTRASGCDSERDLTPDRVLAYGEQWLLDNECRALSPRTIGARRFLLTRLVWFLREKGDATCDTTAIRAFLACIQGGHKEDGGR